MQTCKAWALLAIMNSLIAEEDSTPLSLNRSKTRSVGPSIFKMPAEFEGSDPKRFEAAIRRFDEENARDPNRVLVNGASQARELVYAQWLTDWVLKLAPAASEELRLAARCQHLCRWTVPRESYPMTRIGYLQWREGLKKFHAQKAGEILAELGYPVDVITRVQNLR